MWIVLLTLLYNVISSAKLGGEARPEWGGQCGLFSPISSLHATIPQNLHKTWAVPFYDFTFEILQTTLESAEDPSQLQTCIEDLEKAVKMTPKSAQAAYNLASTYHRLAGLTQSMQTLELARNKFNEAGKIFPDFADGLILHALVSEHRYMYMYMHLPVLYFIAV